MVNLVAGLRFRRCLQSGVGNRGMRRDAAVERDCRAGVCLSAHAGKLCDLVVSFSTTSQRDPGPRLVARLGTDCK